MSTVLSDAEIQQALQRLPGWRRNGNAIERVFQFTGFVQAMEFVNQIAEAAEAVNHHPDILINYNKVTLDTDFARLRWCDSARHQDGRKDQRTGARVTHDSALTARDQTPRQSCLHLSDLAPFP